jgi:hypothetical protein
VADLSCRLPEDIAAELERQAEGRDGGKSRIVVEALRYRLFHPEAAGRDVEQLSSSSAAVLEAHGEKLDDHGNRIHALEQLARNQGAAV